MMAGIADRLAGKWRIVETAAWDKQHLDLCGPAYIEIDAEGRGDMAFGALEAALDCGFTPPATNSSGTAPTKAIKSPATDGPTCARTAASKAKSPIKTATRPPSSPRRGRIFQRPVNVVVLEHFEVARNHRF